MTTTNPSGGAVEDGVAEALMDLDRNLRRVGQSLVAMTEGLDLDKDVIMPDACK